MISNQFLLPVGPAWLIRSIRYDMNKAPKSASKLVKLQRIYDILTDFHGVPERPITRDPFELILWEQVAYLAPDERRAQAFELLKTNVGLTPERMLSASDEDLLEITVRRKHCGT